MSLGHYIFHRIPITILKDVILSEMLEIEDIACLEVAAANHSIRDQNLFHELSWARMETSVNCPVTMMRLQPWMCRRRYKLKYIYISLSESFEFFPGRKETSVELLDDSDSSVESEDWETLIDRSFYRAVELNPHLSHIILYDSRYFGQGDIEYDYERTLLWTAKRCSISMMAFNTTSFENVLRGLNAFPTLSSIHWEYDAGLIYYWDNPSEGLSVYPNISSIKFHTGFDDMSSFDERFHPYKIAAHFVQSCPNVRKLDVKGSWVVSSLSEILQACPLLEELSIRTKKDERNTPNNLIVSHASIFPNISKYGSNVKLLRLLTTYKVLDIENQNICRAFGIVFSRLKVFRTNVKFHFPDNVGGESVYYSISEFFRSGPSALTKLAFLQNLPNLDASSIDQFGQSCRNIQELSIVGEFKLSWMLQSISTSCSCLEMLKVEYLKDNANDDLAAPLKLLLQSCKQLASLDLNVYVDITALESLALYGNALTRLIVGKRFSRNKEDLVYGKYLYFPRNSPVFSYKQHRRRMMNVLIIGQFNIEAISLAAFASSFGVINQMTVELATKQTVRQRDIGRVPEFHARCLEVHVNEVSYADFLHFFSAAKGISRLYFHRTQVSKKRFVKLNGASFEMVLQGKINDSPRLHWIQAVNATDLVSEVSQEKYPHIIIEKQSRGRHTYGIRVDNYDSDDDWTI